MTRPVRPQEPSVYRIRVAARLDRRWSRWLGDVVLTDEEDGTTSLTGVVADQAALHGILSRVRDLGAPLISLALVDPAADDDGHPGRAPSGPVAPPASS